MDPNAMPVAPAQPAAQPQAPPSPFYQDKLYYFPEGMHTVFAARTGMAMVYHGWLMIYDAQSNQEVRRVPLNAQNKYSAVFGTVRLKMINGKKTGALDSAGMLYLYNPRLNILSYWFAMFARKRAKLLKQALEQAAA